ncbi:MAG: hypothetical protein ACHQII_02675 [Bacteroidia bacterium]
MKKTIFTFCSITVVCCAIFFACAKDDNSITHVTYVTQSTGGTGGNPNPNGNPSNSGYGTTTATTAGTTTSNSITPTSNLTINGSATSMKSTGAAVSGYYQITTKPATGTASNPQVALVFPTLGVPPTASYNAVGAPPVTGQCQFTFTDASGNPGSPSTGSVSVTAGTPNSCTFSNIVCTCSGTTYTLSGTFQY